MKDKKICVIGLGEVGSQTFTEICKTRKDCIGVDINQEVLNKFKYQNYNVSDKIPKSDIYIVCVYLTETVIEVIKKLNFDNNPMVIIESTIMPGTYSHLIEWKKKNNLNFSLIIFPHRFNPNDSEHHVFNLNRAMGGSQEDVKKALEFYNPFMDKNLIYTTSPEIAELTKPVENAYRFIEIAIAEELKMLCDKKGIDFNELRRIANTKWNIKILEARKGIGLNCLPKDVRLISSFFPDNKFFSTAIKVDDNYKNNLK